jgi:CPA2 family monovalent cation:H+ antiporter-2
MPVHSEVTAAALVVLAALLCGGALARFRQSPIIGYILAGVLLGPSAAGLVTDRAAVNTLAEFGVLLLLFVVGMELDLRRFISQWRVALFATLLQIGGSVGMALLLRHLLGWSLGLSVLLGFVVALSSTAVVIKTLESSGELDTPSGRITLAILIAQDMAVVPMMVVLNALSSNALDAGDLATLAFSIGFLALFMWFLVRRPFPVPWGQLMARHADLAPLGGLALCFGAAALSGLMDLSPAYGAFLAGLAIGNSDHRETFMHSVRPVQAVLLMVFFLSIGLLLDLRFLWQNLGTVLLLLAMVTLFKTALNIGALRLLRQSWAEAALAGIALAQIGEFSFVLTEVGKATRLISPFEANLVISVTVLSLALSPFWLMSLRRLHRLMAIANLTTPRAILSALYGREARILVRNVRYLAVSARRARAYKQLQQWRRGRRGEGTNAGSEPGNPT